MRGFSPRNLKYMRAFAEAWPDRAIVQQVAAQIPWFHNCLLLDRVASPTERAWYVQQAAALGWSRNVLAMQIENEAHRRTGNKIVVEYALRDLKRPIGVAQWETKIVKALPKELKGALPTVREIERELADDVKP